MIPDWQLPSGVDRGLWDYLSSERVAREYDEALQTTPLIRIDVEYAKRWLIPAGKLIDLGCGTGRLIEEFIQRGYDCTGVDLSEKMLTVAREKFQSYDPSPTWIQANLVDLSMIPDASFQHAACLFSTLGMLRGEDNRQKFLHHVRRILVKGGRFVVHAHNRHFQFGFGLGQRGNERGDRTMPQMRGGAPLTLHHFSYRGLVSLLNQSGFRVLDTLLIGANATGKLSWPRFLPRWRAHGFLLACETI